MTLYFIPPTPVSNIKPALDKLRSHVNGLDTILCTIRRDCLETSVRVYDEIPTQYVPISTDLLHEFQNGERETLTTLNKEFAELELMDHTADVCEIIKSNESVETFAYRIKAALAIAHRMGQHVAVVMPTSVIQHWTGITLEPGEICVYPDELSYYEKVQLLTSS